VFLDRDGVLNRAFVVDGVPHPPASPEEMELLPGVREACAALHEAGLLLVVVTNQPDIARGSVHAGSVDLDNEKLRSALPLDDIVVCPHDDADGCECRKPKPGMLVEAARRHGIDLARSVMVGDRWRDIAAGRAAECSTVFVDHGYAEPQPISPDLTVSSLVDAVPWILEHVSSHAVVREEECT
jgi:D-glycero-D-manno-heptose 1,7-bisphosphate phosphatase